MRCIHCLMSFIRKSYNSVIHSSKSSLLASVVLILSIPLATLPAYANPLRNTLYDASIKKWNNVYNPSIPWYWAKAQLVAESGLKPNATSPVGAMGLGQFMPGTWKDVSRELGYGDVSAYNTAYNIQAHAYYMRNLRNQFKAKRPEYDKHSLALASYNAGLGNVLKAQKKGGNSLLYEPMIKALPLVTGHHSKETTDYVNRIWRYTEYYESNID